MTSPNGSVVTVGTRSRHPLRSLLARWRADASRAYRSRAHIRVEGYRSGFLAGLHQASRSHAAELEAMLDALDGDGEG